MFSPLSKTVSKRHFAAPAREYVARYAKVANTTPYVFDFRLKDSLKKYQSLNPTANIPILNFIQENINIDKSTRIKGVPTQNLKTFPKELVLHQEYNVEIIDTLADGSGFGLVYMPSTNEYWTCIVPLALPKEHVTCKFYSYGVSPGYFYAELLSTKGVPSPTTSADAIKFEPHPQRITPKCQHYQSCSACQLQHISYPDQLSWKQRFLEERFKDFHSRTGIPQEYTISQIIQSPKEFGFRTRVSVHHDTCDPNTTIREIGFNSRTSGKTVDVIRCEVLTETLNETLDDFKTKVRKNRKMDGKKTLGATFLLSQTLNPCPEKVTELQMRLKASTAAKSIMAKTTDTFTNEIATTKITVGKSAATENTTTENTLTDDTIEVEELKEWPEKGWNVSVTTDRNEIVTNVINGQVLRFPANSFFQTNSYLVPLLTHFISKTLKHLETTHGVKNLVDAYCGSGLFSLCVKAKQTIGIDIDSQLIRWARINAKLNTQKSVFHLGDVKDLFKKSCTFEAAETCVVLDPPAKGCDAVFLQQILEYKPKCIVYVSCSPKTQVRDLEVLCEKYVIVQVQPFDMFPQSFHIENVVVLVEKQI